MKPLTNCLAVAQFAVLAIAAAAQVTTSLRQPAQRRDPERKDPNPTKPQPQSVRQAGAFKVDGAVYAVTG
jgi:hypothetical protein